MRYSLKNGLTSCPSTPAKAVARTIGTSRASLSSVTEEDITDDEHAIPGSPIVDDVSFASGVATVGDALPSSISSEEDIPDESNNQFSDIEKYDEDDLPSSPIPNKWGYLEPYSPLWKPVIL